MNLHLVDLNPPVVNAWLNAFKPYPEVTVELGDLLSVAHHCVVSPANSYGYMDGGIDDAYRNYFGLDIEKKVQDAIRCRREGNLPVGASLVIRTGHARIPFMIVAPTMATPERVESSNCYRAMRAMLRIVDDEIGKDIFCPGLATGVGRVPFDDAATEMAQAYEDWKNSKIKL